MILWVHFDLVWKVRKFDGFWVSVLLYTGRMVSANFVCHCVVLESAIVWTVFEVSRIDFFDF